MSMIDFNFIKSSAPIRGIIHVGAHEGGEITTYAKACINDVVLVEANPERCQRLKQTLETGRYAVWYMPPTYEQLPEDIAKITKQYHCHNYAITDQDDQEILFNLSSFDGGTDSIFPINDYGRSVSWAPYQNIGQVRVPTLTLDTLAARHKYTQHNFLNVDVEGAELLVLKGAHRLLNSQFSMVMLEVQTQKRFDGSCLKSEVEELLSQYHFRLVHYHDTGKQWGDALYVKNV